MCVGVCKCERMYVCARARSLIEKTNHKSNITVEKGSFSLFIP